MARSDLLRVMISSRVNDPIKFRKRAAKLEDVRRALKKELEGIELLGEPLFEVWINEVAPAEEGSTDSWDTCMGEVRRAHVVLALYNGNAGWGRGGGDVGICHAEMETVLSTAPAKLRVIELEPLAPVRKGADGKRDERFRAYYGAQSRFRAAAKDGEEIVARAKEALRDAVVRLGDLGLREARKGKYYAGAALDWSRMDFRQRAAAMRTTLSEFLDERAGAAADGDGVAVPCGRKKVLFVPHAIPAALSVAPARELVGQPFLRDHVHLNTGGRDWVGPVHLVACHKTVTENQATRLLGFPDATLVTPPFGVYAADDVQKIQLVLLANCRDDTSTRHAAQRLFDWLGQTGEEELLAQRAAARKRIVQAIAKEAGG